MVWLSQNLTYFGLWVLKDTMSSTLKWEELYGVIVECGKDHDPYHFTGTIVDGLKEFFDFDSAMIFFLDGNRNLVDQYLYNFSPNWIRIFNEYYSKMDDNTGSYTWNADVSESDTIPFISYIRWWDMPDSEFLRDYIKENRINESLSFILYDLNRQPRSVFNFDMRDGKKFKEQDVEVLNILVPALTNLHKNFYVKIPGGFRHSNPLYAYAQLTDREVEIVDLICQGVSPANISKILHIATSTTYKHIAHIYEKFHVSSRQALLVKLLNQSA